MNTGARSHTQQRFARRLPRPRRTPSAGRSAILALTALLLTWAMPGLRAVQAQTATAGAFPEDAVEAVFLYRFAGYVQWPVSDHHARFVVDVLGADSVAARLQGLLPDHPIHGLPAEVRRIQGLSSLGDAQ